MTSYDKHEDLGTILMRVIRTLSEITDSGEEREEEKRELERQFRQSDQKLDSLVLQHQKDLTKTMQLYAKVNNRLTASRTRVKSMKERLVSCKELLHYKRDELKKLWLDGVEHKYVLEMLERIEELKDCPEKVNSLLSKKQTLEATQVLVQALGHIYGDLKNVDGLVEVKEVLDAKKEKLYETLIEDLTKQLYVQSTWEVENSFRERQGSFRNENPFRRSGSDRGSSGLGGKPSSLRKVATNSSARKVEEMRRDGSGKRFGTDLPIRARKLFLEPGASNAATQFKLISLVEEGEIQKILENPKLADIQEGPAHAIIIDVECISLLNKLPEAIEHLKSELLNELQGIVNRSTTTLNETGPFPQGDNRLLPELFTMVVDQFGLVIDAYRLFSSAIQKSQERTQCEPVKFDLAEVWARVQSNVQMMLTDYLDFKSSKSAAIAQQNAAMQNAGTGSALGGGVVNGPHSVSSLPSTYTDNAAGTIADINSYFVRRKTQKPKRESLFRFDYSSTAISMNDYLKEQSSDGAKEKALVCPPNPHNITSIYPSLMDFVEIVETALKCDPGTHCTLYAFLMDYIKDVFLGQIHADNGNALNSASLSLDSWKAITDSDILRELKVSRPLLQSTVSVKQSIDELNRYMRTLPLYCEHFLTMICNMVMQYKEICLAAYRGVVQPESEDKRIISAQWAKDDDIARFLKSLPNWQAVKTPDADNAESPQEVEQRNAKETAMLKGNLGASEIPSHEILYDPVQLRSLAQLQESLDWFARNVLSMAKEFHNSNSATIGTLPKLPDNSVQTLISLAREFEDLSSTCLLVLHLEVRVHCFHYLHPIWRGTAGAQFYGGLDSTDPNTEVTKLTKDLVQIEDALTNSLHERKTRYIFEGVSHLIAAILIGAAEQIRKINGNGVKKMCRNIFAVQHTLTSSITGSRETSLDHAKQYYEMFNQRQQEVLNGIVEKGPIFSAEEYSTAIKLLHRSDPNRPGMHSASGSNDALQANLDKLQQILGEVGVRV